MNWVFKVSFLDHRSGTAVVMAEVGLGVAPPIRGMDTIQCSDGTQQERQK